MQSEESRLEKLHTVLVIGRVTALWSFSDFRLPPRLPCQSVHCTYWEWFYPKSASIRALGIGGAVAPAIFAHSYPAEVGTEPRQRWRMQLCHKTRSGLDLMYYSNTVIRNYTSINCNLTQIWIADSWKLCEWERLTVWPTNLRLCQLHMTLRRTLGLLSW